MFLCLPFVTNSTKYLVVYSLVYHTIKSRGVRKDAMRRFSPEFGIMRVVIDKFYLHSRKEAMVTVVRLLLQGLDTFVHGMILRDLWNSSAVLQVSSTLSWPSIGMIQVVFTIWVAHAAMNQLFRCSTATIMVLMWRWLTANTRHTNTISKESFGTAMDSDDETTTDSGISDSVSSRSNGYNETNDDDDASFIVRDLLREGRVHSELNGRRGAASGGVDTAVRVETMLAILSVVYVVVFDDVPFKIATLNYISIKELFLFGDRWTLLLYAYLLWSVLYAASVKLLPNQRGMNAPVQQKFTRRLKFTINTGFLAIILLGISTSKNLMGKRIKLLALLLASWVVTKSFLSSLRWRGPKIFWNATALVELGVRAALANLIADRRKESIAVIDAFVCVLWLCRNIILPSGAADVQLITTAAPDIAFLGHPSELSDFWALLLVPYSLLERWKCPWWAVPLWPIHYAAGYYFCNWHVKVFGDAASFVNCDDVNYAGLRMQTWTSYHFGRHFMTSPRQVKQNIEATARYANEAGVKVLCLGALNKAESINEGGVGLVRSLGAHSSISIIHGNHLTAAAVVATTHQCFGENAKVFLTGASSKVGWAVAQALRDRFGYEILCHSTDPSRRDLFKEKGFQTTSSLHDGVSYSNLWIVGKYDLAVANLMPQQGTAIVFAVPHPLHNRKDVRVIEAGTLHMDLSRLDRPRQFTNKLKDHEIFACHAAGLVAAQRIKCGKLELGMHETGPVDPNSMDGWLKDAEALGFSVPFVEPVQPAMATGPSGVVIGAGPAGLAVAASLRLRGVLCTVLEEQTDPDAFGSWEKHFSGLEVTTQKHWCQLPGFAMSDKDFPGEFVTAKDYSRYLKLYTQRFGIKIERGFRVKRIARGGDVAPWIVECEGCEEPWVASAVVVATGKNRVPMRETSGKTCSKLSKAGIRVVHSTDLKDDQTWKKAITAAHDGKLCIVGFGNSAADICTIVLQSCGRKNGSTAIHVAVRTVPPVFPRRHWFLRVDTMGFIIRWMPSIIQEQLLRLLWWIIPISAACNAAFPDHLPRWRKVDGRVPVIDKYGQVASGLQSGAIIGHGPIRHVSSEGITFEDTSGIGGNSVSIDMVIMATGYTHDCLITREDRLNGLYLAGFGNERFLPLKTIGEEAKTIARDIELCQRI
jgi:putative flavoprotein involved in K+ transport